MGPPGGIPVYGPDVRTPCNSTDPLHYASNSLKQLWYYASIPWHTAQTKTELERGICIQSV